MTTSSVTVSVYSLCERARILFPGLALWGVVAMTAQFLSEQYATPAMLLALLLGIAIVAAGMKINLEQILTIRAAAIALIVVETAFVAIFIAAGVNLLT